MNQSDPLTLIYLQEDFPPWKLSLPKAKFRHMSNEVKVIDSDLISPDQFVNWENLDSNSITEGPQDIHLLVDIPWITILKILIEVN